MVNSVGTKLQQARIGKQLSVEEASRVTRIRPDKLMDLEEDNYSNFPSMSYAKGFLLIYAKFLGVDVRDFADTLHAPNPVGSDDYEYLSAAASGPQPAPSRRPYHFSPRRQSTILPVIVFGVLAAAIGLVIYLTVSFQRIGPLPTDDQSEKKDASASAASPAAAISTPPPVPLPASPAPIASAAPAPPVLRSLPPAIVAASPVPAPSASPAPATASESPAPGATFDPSREVRRAEPVFPTPQDHADASPAAPSPVASGPALSAVAPMASPTPDTLKQVSILPIRKTRVTIRRDVADSTPVFEDWLYPGDGALKLRGHKFWIQVEDPAAVQITQDGQPLQAGQSDIQIE